MEISSRDYYKEHGPSYSCSAEVKEGKVLFLYMETGREGGQIWMAKYPNGANGNLQECLTSLGNRYGWLFYDAVIRAADKESLISTVGAKSMVKKRKIKAAEKEVARTKRAYDAAKTKLQLLKSVK